MTVSPFPGSGRPADADAFADEWCRLWNAQDVEGILGHFAEEVVFSSPLAEATMPETHGILVGKEQLRLYWTAALARVPDLKFQVEQVFTSVDSIVIRYRNHRDISVCEVFFFESGKVIRGCGAYPV